MKFFGGLNQTGSLFFRYQPCIVAVMEVTEAEVSIRVGGKFNVVDEPIRWSPVELKSNVSRGGSIPMSGYVGEEIMSGLGSTLLGQAR